MKKKIIKNISRHIQNTKLYNFHCCHFFLFWQNNWILVCMYVQIFFIVLFVLPSFLRNDCEFRLYFLHPPTHTHTAHLFRLHKFNLFVCPLLLLLAISVTAAFMFWKIIATKWCAVDGCNTTTKWIRIKEKKIISIWQLHNRINVAWKTTEKEEKKRITVSWRAWNIEYFFVCVTRKYEK